MTDPPRWTGARSISAHLVEQRFYVARSTGEVPAVAWLPLTTAPCPLVLLGHGGSGHKANQRNVDLATHLASCGVASLAIDGPCHGERVAAPAYQQLIAERGIGVVTEQMIDDWRAAIAALATRGAVATSRLGYVGLSMGTRWGLPLCAALGEDLRAAVVGKFGLRSSLESYAGREGTQLIRRSAQAITAPVLFHLPWDDEIFPREGQLELFDLLGSRTKRLIADSGSHGDTDAHAPVTWASFIVGHLGP